jgi:uncharacterized protein YkwD
MRKWTLVLLMSMGLSAFSTSIVVQAQPIQQVMWNSSAMDLLDAVNALRASKGLPPYRASAILMEVTQAQADYLASSGLITHIGADGSEPYQRALAAGYPLAGDVSQGGYYSENVAAGTNMSAPDAVTMWMGDAPYQNTMLSTLYQDAGVGMTVSGNIVYFALDAGLSTGGTPVPYTPPAQSVLASSPSVGPSSTQGAGATITYVVKAGDSLYAIAQAWGVSVDALLQANNLTLGSIIYPGQQLAIPVSAAPTPVPNPSSTPILTAMVLSPESPTGVSSVMGSSTPPSSDPGTKSVNPMIGVIVVGLGVLLLIITGVLVFNRARGGK